MGRKHSSLFTQERYSDTQRGIPPGRCYVPSDGTMERCRPNSQARPSESSGKNNDEIQDVSRNNVQLCDRHQEIDT